MKPNDLEWMVEEYAAQLFKANKLIKGKSIVHYEEDKQAKSDRIVCKAAIGERNLVGGIGGFSVDLKVTHYSSGPDRRLTRKAIVEAMFESPSTRPAVPIAGNFERLDLGDDVSSERSQSDNAREYSATFHFLIAKLANTSLAAGVN